MNRRRLEAEALRDSVLRRRRARSTARLGGPMVRVPLEPEVYDLIFTEGEPDGLWPVTPDAARAHPPQPVPVQQAQRPPAAAGGVRPARHADLVPGAAGQHVRPAGADPAQRPVHAAAEQGVRRPAAAARRGPTRGRIDRAYRLALARPPRPEELKTALDFLESQTTLLRERLRWGDRRRHAEGTSRRSRSRRSSGAGRFLPGDVQPQRVRVRAVASRLAHRASQGPSFPC